LQVASTDPGGESPRRQGQNLSQQVLGALSDLLNRVAKHGGVQSETPSPDTQWVEGGFVFTLLE